MDLSKHKPTAFIENEGFRVEIRYLNPLERDKITAQFADAETWEGYFHLLKKVILGWSGLKWGGKDLAFNDKNIEKLVKNAPDLAHWITTSAQMMWNFTVSADIYLKNLGGQRRTSENGANQAGSPQVAQGA